MPDLAERFVALASRPIPPDAELELACQDVLRRHLAGNPAGAAEEMEKAADALEEADRHPGRQHRWRFAIYGLAAAAALPMLVHSNMQLRQFAASGQLGLPSSMRTVGTDFEKRLSAGEKLILRGGESARNASERWKPLWQGNPENPAYLLEYAAAYYKDHDGLSPEILEAAARIDPDNAWYPVIQAAGKAKTAVKKHSPGYSERKRGAKPTFTVSDEAKLAEALGMFHQATRKSRLVASDPDLLRQRVGLLPPRTDCVSHFPRLLYLSSQTYGSIDYRYLADAITVQAGRLAERKDAAGFRQLTEDWKWLVTSSARDGTSLIDLMVARAVYSAPLDAFREAAQALGLQDEADRFAAMDQRIKEMREESRQSINGKEWSNSLESKGSILAMLTAVPRWMTLPPPLTEADLGPGRYAEHAVFGRACSLVSWVVFGLAAVSRFRVDRVTAAVAKRLQACFRFRDWVWVFLGGIAAPLLWAFLITRLTPLGAREWSMKPSGFLLPVGQMAAVTVLMLTASAAIGSRRLGKRIGFLGQKPLWPSLGWIATACAALAIPAIGTLMFLSGGFLTGCTLLGVALLWLLWNFGSLVFNKPRAGSLRRTTLAGLMVPVWVSGMLVFSLLAGGFYLEERHWISRDHLLEITADAPASTRYEFDVTQVLRKEMLELAGAIP